MGANRFGDALGDPTTTAVVCVEGQNGVIGTESILPALAEASVTMLDTLTRLLTGARRGGVPVVHTTLEGFYPGTDQGPAPIWRIAGPASASWAPGVAATQVVPQLLADTDIVVPRRHGLFPTSGTELLSVLTGMGVKTVVLTGVSLNLALPHTAGDLVEAGISVVIPRDAVAGTPIAYGEDVLRHTMAMLGRLTAVDDLLGHWSTHEVHLAEELV